MLVMCKWLSVQASCKIPGALATVRGLLSDPVYNLKVPNTVRALLGSFIQNHVQFHAVNGEGYAFIADQIAIVDALNPHLAAMLAGGFKKFAKVDAVRQKMMRREIEKLLSMPKLSSNSYEILSKCIQEVGLCEKA
jgi:aminopeptidase N